MSEVKEYLGVLLPGDNGYVANGRRWDASTLRDAIKTLEPFDFNLNSINLEVYPWDFNGWSLYHFLYHTNRIENCTFDEPIILSPTGHIIDGYHRVCKAIMQGKDTIKAVRLFTMPEPDEIYKDDE